LAIETVDLRKHFDGTEALRGLNLRVPRGSIFGFLGRNGAGKTGARSRVAGGRAVGQRHHSRAHRLRRRKQGALRLHDGGRDHPLHRVVLSGLAA
jgi:ABC-type branched-subunit amino acid transport system ATPase component